MSSATNRQNILQLIRNRELNDHIHTKYALRSNLDYKCISKLGLLAELEGHDGYYLNCLQWNKSGSALASTSDDQRVILWDPFLQKVKTTIETLQNGSIYSVKFLPCSNDDIIVTGAGDRSTHTYNVTTGKQLSSCICSQGRIKYITVANDEPSLFWCASEDGCISQHDMRMTHKCSTDGSKTTLVTIYSNLGKKIEARCLDINQFRTEQLAVGANDSYARLYDRRMIQLLSSFDVKYHSNYVLEYDGNKAALNNINNAVQYLIPGHIHSNDNKTIIPFIQKYVITYLTFSPDGQELLVNYGGEYVYLYNLVNQADNAFFNIHKVMKVPRENGEGSSTDLIDDQVFVSHLTVPDKVMQLKLKANHLFEKEDYTAAIVLYNEAINIHNCSVLFSDRAAAYIKREWIGDFYAALKDCVTALKLEPNQMKAHFWLAVCLFKLGKIKDSKMYLEQFAMKYPSYKTSAAYKCFYSDLLNAQSNNNDKYHGKKSLDTLDNNTSNFLDELHIEQAQKINFEKYFRNQAKDYHRRYYGHLSKYTGIKEANFFGSQNQFIVAGSDDGLFLIWEKNTENNLLVLKGDSCIVNCIQPHPSEFLLATSGIDSEIKLWSPLPNDLNNSFIINDYSTQSVINQRYMTAHHI